MSASNFHRNHGQHISISEKLSEELKKTGDDLLKQLNDSNQTITNQLLLKVINGIIRGMYGVIPDLQEVVIKSNIKEHSADLKIIIKKLSQYCNDMVQSYDNDLSTLKQKFKSFVQNILLLSGDLLNIIKKDSLHDFKHELVENLKEMMYMLQIYQIRIEVENYSQQELKNLVDRIRKECLEDISIIEKCSLEVLKTVAIHIKYNTKHGFQMAYQLNKMASNYHDVNIQNKILKAAHLINTENTNILLINEKLSDNKEITAALTKYITSTWDSVQELFDFIEFPLENQKHTENLKDVAMFVVSYAAVVNSHIGKSIKNDALHD